MPRPAARSSSAAAITALVLLALVTSGHSQASLVVAENVGLPAVDEGVLPERTHTPFGEEALRRDSVRMGAMPMRRGAAGLSYAPGKVIVKFRDGASASSHVSALSTASRTATVSTRPAYADFDIVRIDPGEDAEVVAAALTGRADVEYAQPAYRMRTELVPNDPLYSRLQWNLPLIGMERAWDIQPQAGSTITVAVLDTGVAYQNATVTAVAHAFVDDQGNSYPALGPVTLPYSAATQLVSPGRFVAPRDFIWNGTTPLDFHGHGTHVAGTIGQLTNDGIGTAGVAFNVKLMPVKVIDEVWDDIFGAPNAGTDDLVAMGIRYAVDNGAKILNMSIGRTGPAGCGTNPSQLGCAPVIESAINYAVSHGAFVAIAAGNDFDQGNPTEVLAEIASRIKGAVSVAAIDRTSNHAIYSSSGSYIELAAPGGGGGLEDAGFVWQQTFDFRVVETYLLPPARYTAPRFDVMGYVGYAGTSMATPHVSGVAAMLMQQGLTDPAAIETALERFAIDLGAPGRDDLYGFGLVDARNTLRGLGLAK